MYKKPWLTLKVKIYNFTAKCIRFEWKRKNNLKFCVHVLSIILFRSYECVHCVHFFEASVLISASFMQHSCQHIITQHTPASLMTHTHTEFQITCYWLNGLSLMPARVIIVKTVDKHFTSINIDMHSYTVHTHTSTH